MEALTLLRRLAEQHNYPALHEACLETHSSTPGIQILQALAAMHLGNASAGHNLLASLDHTTLEDSARIDLAGLHIALGELGSAITVLETLRQETAARESSRQSGTVPAENADRALLLARLAWCRLQQGRNDDALALYEESLSHRPMLAVYHNLLRLYRDQSRLDEMTACLDAAWDFWVAEQANWPEDQRPVHNQRLRAAQLDLWLARHEFEAAEDWVEGQRDVLGEDDWCALLSALAERLAARDRHAQAEEWLRRGLRRYPQHVGLYGQLAELAHIQGRSIQAIALLRRAIRVADARHQPTGLLWTRLSATALPFDPALAREAAERAQAQLAEPSGTSAGDLHTQVELALAGVEVQEQDYPAAEARYRQVLARRPELAPALQGLGQMCLQLGRIDEAVKVFERIRAIDPTRGHGALINARRFPDDVATLEGLERAARTPGLEGSVRSGLLFQLAAAWEKREDYDRAFALADEANAANRRLLRYDPGVHRQSCARIRHAFPRTLFEHRGGSGHDSTLPVFVVGMPRSGTTLVEQIIAGHSRIHGAGELGTIPQVIAGLERWERHTGSGRRYPDCVDDLDPTVIRGIAESVLKEFREYGPGADHVVDKLPHNFENIGLIRLLFPRAKIISVRRDPRDVAVSNFFLDFAAKHGGMGFAYDLDWIGEQLADHHLLMHHWHEVVPGEILEVDYEALVDDPETSARRLLAYIGVDWEPQVLDFAALARPVRTASVWQVRQPLYSSSKARWQRFRPRLAPLFTATNRKITWAPIEMVTLPEPGWLNAGVDRYRQGDLDGAEYRFKQLLHHVPEHAAACFMLGLIYVRKGHHDDGIALMAPAVERCPFNRHWRRDLIQACRLAGRDREADALAAELEKQPAAAADGEDAAHKAAHAGEAHASHFDYLFLSGELQCSSSASATSGGNG